MINGIYSPFKNYKKKGLKVEETWRIPFIFSPTSLVLGPFVFDTKKQKTGRDVDICILASILCLSFFKQNSTSYIYDIWFVSVLVLYTHIYDTAICTSLSHLKMGKRSRFTSSSVEETDGTAMERWFSISSIYQETDRSA